MHELDECLSAARAIKDIDEQIQEIKSRAMSPKNQIITGMPRSTSGFGGKSDDYVIKLERLNNRRQKRINARDEHWNTALNIFNDINIREDHIHLLWLRFYCGMQWDKCCTLMAEKYPERNWNINKIFRAYRNVLSKTDNS